MGVELDIRESSTCSKNMIPAQDVRIKALQKFLVVAYNNKDWTSQHAAYWALRMYNQSISNVGFAPAELFHRRKLGSQADIGISDEWLKSKVDQIRKQKRDAADEQNAKLKKKKRLEIVPYQDVFLNSGEMLEDLDPSRQLLKVKDCVKLHKAFDKADLNRLWTVISIDWKAKKFVGIKENMGTRGKPRKWSLEAIDQVVTNVSPILAVLTEQQKRRRRMAKGISELWGIENQYSIYPTERENEANTMVMVDDSGILSPEDGNRSTESYARFEMGVDKFEQEVYPVASTPLQGEYVPETPYSEYCEIEMSMISGEGNTFNDTNETLLVTQSSGLNESDLDDTLVETRDVAGNKNDIVPCNKNTDPIRRSGRQSVTPDRLGINLVL